MNVEIVKKETIKPSSPTPFHLKTYNVSVTDQISPSIYISLVFMYPNDNNDQYQYDQFSQNLKNSLSDTLTLFPPLAGKIKYNVSVDCNDDGVMCYETRVSSTLAQLLIHRDIECLKRLVVVGEDVNVDTGVQLLVQINLFECGGIALGVSFSHKLGDAAALATFLKTWSARATDSDDHLMVVPVLTASPTFPPRKDVSMVRPVISPPSHNFTTTRLVLDGSNVDALKIKSASQNTPQPTRVEAVTALIGKCAMAASKSNEKGYSIPYLITHAVNIRKKLKPSFPETAFGNITGVYVANYSGQSGASLNVLADILRKGRMEYYEHLARNGKEKVDEYVAMMERPAVMLQEGDSPVVEMHNIFTSWCRFGLYETDLGLGKPVWVGIPISGYMNVTVLMDTEDGNGIEAYVTLTKNDMALFQADPLLLQYASGVYPAV